MIVFLNGGDLYSLSTIIEETAHVVQFLQVWDDLKQHRIKNLIKRQQLTTGYSQAKQAWAQNYIYFSIKGLGYDNQVEQWAKGKVEEVLTDLKKTYKDTVCGFSLEK
jgi:hypothetical protein